MGRTLFEYSNLHPDIKTHLLREHTLDVKRQRQRDLYLIRRAEERKYKIRQIFDLFEIGKYD